MSSKGDESLGQTTPVPQTSLTSQRTPGAPVKVKRERRLKASKVAVSMSLKDIREQIEANKASAEAKVIEELVKQNEAKEEESIAKQQLDEADENLKRCRDNPRIAADELDQAEKQYELAFKAHVAASQKVTEANEALEKATSNATSAEKMFSKVAQSVSLEVEDTLNVNEDDLNSKYSKFRSYSKDKHPNYPIRVWTMTKEHLSFIKIYYVVPDSLTAEEANDRIKTKLYENAENIKKHGDFWFDMPRRNPDFLEFCPSLAMPMLRKGFMFRRSFKDRRTRRAACLTAFFLNLLYERTSEGKTVTLREVFYEGKYMFKTADEAASILADICAFLECTTASVGVIPRQKGTIIGNLRMKMVDDPVPIECSRISTFIPYDTRKIHSVLLDDSVECVLVLEKGTMYDRFAQPEFYVSNNCVIVCGYGQPDERTRRFLRIVEESSSVPIYGLTDPDPYGVSIVKTYARGSDSLAYCNLSLAAVSLHWIGISTAEIKELEVAHKVKILKRCPTLSITERSMLENLKSDNRMLSELWVERIDHMLALNKKACFEDLVVLGRDYVTEHLVPELISRVKKDIEAYSKVSRLCATTPKKLNYSDLKMSILHGNDVYFTVLSPIMILKKLSASSVPHRHLIDHLAKASSLKNKNFVAVLGYCTSPNQDEYFLAYEEAPMGSLHDVLHGEKRDHLSWNQRLAIATSAARGLLFLHVQEPTIVHGAIRSTKILVFHNYEAKIADFCFCPRSARSHYDAPGYVLNQPNQKDDVYSFGVVLLELLTGEDLADTIGSKKLVDWAKTKLKGDKILCVGPSSESTDPSVIRKFADIVLECFKKAKQRPSMDNVHRYLAQLQAPAV